MTLRTLYYSLRDTILGREVRQGVLSPRQHKLSYCWWLLRYYAQTHGYGKTY